MYEVMEMMNIKSASQNSNI